MKLSVNPAKSGQQNQKFTWIFVISQSRFQQSHSAGKFRREKRQFAFKLLGDCASNLSFNRSPASVFCEFRSHRIFANTNWPNAIPKILANRPILSNRLQDIGCVASSNTLDNRTMTQRLRFRVDEVCFTIVNQRRSFIDLRLTGDRWPTPNDSPHQNPPKDSGMGQFTSATRPYQASKRFSK